MVISSRAITRSADPKDLSRLANLVHFEVFVHRHLDYRPPLDWIGYTPFLVLEQASRIEAALACPPDPPAIAWIRLFAAATQIPVTTAWDVLWSESYNQLIDRSQNPLCSGDSALWLVRGAAEKEPFSKDPFHRHAQLGQPEIARTPVQPGHNQSAR